MASNTTAKKSTVTNWRQVVAVGIGVAGLIWMSTTQLAPIAVGLVIAAIIFQAVHGSSVGTFFSWLSGKG